jgi:glycosyltransferase involved in cell wall biosynthesis
MLVIAQVSQFERQGGAAAIANQLFQNYRALGHSSWLITAQQPSTDPNILPLLADTPVYFWQGQLHNAGHALQQKRGGWQIGSLAKKASHPRRAMDRWLGHEDFEYPASYRFLDRLPQRPDILHMHNLHGGFFDLRALPKLSRQIPLMLTMHDNWLMTGHCAYFFECERWKTGCGHCPDLTIYPYITRDKTAYNWQVKADIYKDSRLYVATPCRWLMDQVDQSMLRPGIVEQRVIYNGVDTSVFQPPTDKRALRQKLGIPLDARVILFAANGIRQNQFKDYSTMRITLERLVEMLPETPIWFVALGEDAPSEMLSEHARIHFVPFQKSLSLVADYYGAADVYLHAAKADTFPNVVLEALSCGLPVVATAVGGIPEQVMGLALNDAMTTLNRADRETATGALTAKGDSAALAQALAILLPDETLRAQLGANAVRHVQQNFTLAQQTQGYLDWYEEILARLRG